MTISLQHGYFDLVAVDVNIVGQQDVRFDVLALQCCREYKSLVRVQNFIVIGETAVFPQSLKYVNRACLARLARAAAEVEITAGLQILVGLQDQVLQVGYIAAVAVLIGNPGLRPNPVIGCGV